MKQVQKVIITGVSGQDGANMVQYLLENHVNTKLYGMVRRTSTKREDNYIEFKSNPRFEVVHGDLTDEYSIISLVKKIKPDYFINFGANSFVAASWDTPSHVFDVNANGVLRCLEAIKNFAPKCKFYSAGSSEEFGDVDYSPQDFKHPLKPRSPYGASKCAARHLVKVYRESYGIYAVHGTLFNHEGVRRGEEFVTRKITKGVARIHHFIRDIQNWRSRRGEAPEFDPIELGNIYTKRDWSDSDDFVKGVWMMLNQEDYIETTPDFNKEFESTWNAFEQSGCALGSSDVHSISRDIVLSRLKDYVLSSGETHTIKEFVEKAFNAAGFQDCHWEGEGTFEEYCCTSGPHNKLVMVRINPKFYRPAEVDLLVGDSIPIRDELGWKPSSTIDDLINKMVKHDIKNYAKEKEG